MSNKYILGKTIALPVNISGLPESIEVEGNTLVVKKEFHVSLVCIGKIIIKYDLSIPDFVQKVVDDFCEFTKVNDISLTKYHDEYRLVEKDDRKSLVVMCDVSNLDKFFDLINEKYQLNIEHPPIHVSLYTLPGKGGIFLANSEDIDKLTNVVPHPSGILL